MLVIVYFVHVTAVEEGDPCLNVPFGNQVDNLLLITPGINGRFRQGRLKLCRTMRDSASVRINNRHHCCCNPRSPLPIRRNGIRITLTYPLFPGARRELFETELVDRIPLQIKTPPSELLLGNVLGQHNNERLPAHEIQPRAINSDGGRAIPSSVATKDFARVMPPFSRKNRIPNEGAH